MCTHTHKRERLKMYVYNNIEWRRRKHTKASWNSPTRQRFGKTENKNQSSQRGDKAVSTYKILDFFLLMYISWYKDLGFFCSESKNQSSQESVIRQCQCTKI